MATVQDIKRRVRSVRNTRKITRALELVAAAKLKRAQSRIEDMRPYADRMLELMAGTARASSSVRGLPLLQKHEQEQTVAIVPLTGDRGLAGAFNSQILRRAIALERSLRAEGTVLKEVQESGDLPDELAGKLDAEIKKVQQSFHVEEADSLV